MRLTSAGWIIYTSHLDIFSHWYQLYEFKSTLPKLFRQNNTEWKCLYYLPPPQWFIISYESQHHSSQFHHSPFHQLIPKNPCVCFYLSSTGPFSFYTCPLFVSPLCITIFERYWNWGTVQIVLYMERCWKAKRYCESDDPWQMKCQPKWLSANICQIIQHTAGRAHNSNNNNFRTWVDCVIKTSQELRMLSSVTLNFQVTKIVTNSSSQLSEVLTVSQMS